jgi:hypothetical protein
MYERSLYVTYFYAFANSKAERSERKKGKMPIGMNEREKKKDEKNETCEVSIRVMPVIDFPIDANVSRYA